jgi:PelA/Pel-15E family pectate lyase
MAQQADPTSSARSALRKGVEFFRSEVAVTGTYLWQYSEDLSKREGEGKATATQAWVQPPGTPSVGLALLKAFEATGDRYYFEAARETAHGLIQGQLKSGGWTYLIELDPKERKRFAYRTDAEPAKNARNVTTLDDGTTQTAVRFLARFDRAAKGEDKTVREALEYAIDSLLKAQYPNGAWPQGYSEFPDAEKFKIMRASYPAAWSRDWPGAGQYWLRYTLNDGALMSMIEVMLELGEPRCRAAAEKAGDFLLLAQMPGPQSGWAQQYDFEMHPAWARKFEPPSITGGESQGVLRTLLVLYRETGQQKYLEPFPRALEYLRRSRLPDGKLARFYELRTNKPLYFTKDYELTYDDSDPPQHYGFKVADDTEAIRREYEQLKADRMSAMPKAVENLEAQVKKILAAQDARGRWVESGRLRHHGPNNPETKVIRTATFVRNIEVLSRYLADINRKDPN